MGRRAGTKEKGRHLVPAKATPSLTLGDVVTLLQPSTWTPPGRSSPLRAVQRALAAALAAGARIGGKDAMSITYAEASAERLSLPDRTGRQRPVLFLPVIVALIGKLERLRPAGADPALFVSGKGAALTEMEWSRDMRRLGSQWGFHGGGLPTRLFEFFDACFASENDRAAVAVLRRRTGEGLAATRKAVEEAALDEGRLRDVLEGHLLAGPPGRWIGARGVSAAEPTMRLFRRRRIRGSGRSQALATDPVCIAMARIRWPERGQRTLRRLLVDAHFDHLEKLHVAGRLSMADLAYLFNAGVKWVEKKKGERALAKLSDGQRTERRVWIDGLPGLYLARPRGEGFARFHARISPLTPAHVPDSKCFLHLVLVRAGVR